MYIQLSTGVRYDHDKKYDYFQRSVKWCILARKIRTNEKLR